MPTSTQNPDKSDFRSTCTVATQPDLNQPSAKYAAPAHVFLLPVGQYGTSHPVQPAVEPVADAASASMHSIQIRSPHRVGRASRHN